MKDTNWVWNQGALIYTESLGGITKHKINYSNEEIPNIRNLSTALVNQSARTVCCTWCKSQRQVIYLAISNDLSLINSLLKRCRIHIIHHCKLIGFPLISLTRFQKSHFSTTFQWPLMKFPWPLTIYYYTKLHTLLHRLGSINTWHRACETSFSASSQSLYQSFLSHKILKDTCRAFLKRSAELASVTAKRKCTSFLLALADIRNNNYKK